MLGIAEPTSLLRPKKVRRHEGERTLTAMLSLPVFSGQTRLRRHEGVKTYSIAEFTSLLWPDKVVASSTRENARHC